MSPSGRGVGTNVMKKALSQISKSPFTRGIEKAKLPRRLNASKCSFGVRSGKFLGYMVTHRGIEVNPDQIKTINNLRSPRNPKEVQKLTAMATVLNRFISRPEIGRASCRERVCT